VRAFWLVVASMVEKVADVRSMRKLTHVLTAATAAMALVAACTSTTFEQVGGTVIDGRAGKPVAHAQLEATAPQRATVAGSTDVQGRFTLREVHKRATLKITAANYELASLHLEPTSRRARDRSTARPPAGAGWRSTGGERHPPM
jgi:hypothetical protein